MSVKKSARLRRAKRTRSKISQLRMKRLCVYRTPRHIYAQIIDDTSGKTIASASSLSKDFKEKGSDINGASKVGSIIGEKGINAGIKDVFFDRGKYRYHGRVKALADGAREAGLIF